MCVSISGLVYINITRNFKIFQDIVNSIDPGVDAIRRESTRSRRDRIGSKPWISTTTGGHNDFFHVELKKWALKCRNRVFLL